MAYMVVAYVVMAYIVMAYIVMAQKGFILKWALSLKSDDVNAKTAASCLAGRAN